MAQEGFIEVRFAGGDIAPDKVRARDLAKLIVAVEDMLAAVVSAEDTSIRPEEVVVGLVDVERGSVNLQFAAPREILVRGAFERIIRALQELSFGGLPRGAVSALQVLSEFTRKTNTVAELRLDGAFAYGLATITPEMQIRAAPLVALSTTLYGKVLRVGGKRERKPHMMLETTGRRTIYCQVPSRLVRELGSRLYTWVGVAGTAQWDSQVERVEGFQVERILPYKDTSLLEAFDGLAALIGPSYADIEDVEQYVAHLRADDGEDE